MNEKDAYIEHLENTIKDLQNQVSNLTEMVLLLRKEKFVGPGPKLNSYVDEFDTVAREIRAGLTESAMVPLQATSDVMHILDEIRHQIGLVYTDLE